MFRFIKKVFIVLLNFRRSLGCKVNVSNFSASLSLNNQPCMTRQAINDLSPGWYNQGFCYYTLMDDLDRSNGNCNTLADPSSKISAPNKTKDKNLSAFNMIMRKNE